MSDDFATALRRALASTRAGDPAAATALIQSALSGRSAPGSAPDPEAECGPCAKAAAAAKAGGRTGGISGMGDLSGLPGMDGLKGFSGLSGLGGKAARSAPVPDGARVETRTIAGREVRLFTPSPRAGGVAGLVLMLHGCTQSPEDFALGTTMDLAAEAAGYAVAYPAQTGTHNMQSCWNWFRPQDQEAGGGEPASLAAIAREIAGELDVGARVFAAGLSAGGAMAAILAETHPDLFAAVGVHSGLPAGAAGDMGSAFAAMRGERTGRPLARPGIVFHGTADTTVSPRNAHALLPGDGVETRHGEGTRTWTRLTTPGGSELWMIEGAGHAWSGGDVAGSYADAAGPDASAEMLRFFGEVAARG